MKKKQFQEYKQKTVQEIGKRITQLQKEKTEARLQVKIGKVKNVHYANAIKKEIAQLKTLNNLKNIAKLTKQESQQKEQNGTN